MEQEYEYDSGSADSADAVKDTSPKPLLKLKQLFSDVFPRRETKSIEMTTSDVTCLLVLAALGILLRVFRIQFPPHSVYDEVRFIEIINCYINGTYFHDVHPPLAKMIMALFAYLADYEGKYKASEYVLDRKYPAMTYVAMRLTQAFFSGLCVPLTYFTMRMLMCSCFTSCVAALFVCFDLMLIAEARHIFADGILQFSSCLALCSVVLYERVDNVWFFVFEGLCLGFASSCKYTTSGILALAILRQFQIYGVKRGHPEFQVKFKSAAIRSALLFAIVIFVHFLALYFHISFLPYEPAGDVPMPNCVRRGLVKRAAPDWEARSNGPSTLRKMIALALFMPRTRTESHVDSPYSSSWYSWPLFSSRWVVLWEKDARHVICLGNILIWYPVFFGVVAGLARVLLTDDKDSNMTMILFGYLLCWVPFALVRRDLFLYHYSIPLILGYWHLAMIISDHLSGGWRGFAYSFLVFLAIVGFWIWAPLVYGLSTPDTDFLVWKRAWRP